MSKDSKKIVKDVVKGLKELDRKGELARMGKIVGEAARKLFEETRGWRNRRLPWVGESNARSQSLSKV